MSGRRTGGRNRQGSRTVHRRRMTRQRRRQQLIRRSMIVLCIAFLCIIGLIFLCGNVPYAQKHIRYILKHEICRVFRCKYSGKLKEESSPWIIESLSCPCSTKGDAWETSDKKVKIRDFIGVDCSCVITEIFSFRFV